MKKFVLFFVFAAIVFAPATGQKVKLENQTDSVSYAIGLSVAMNLKNQGVVDLDYQKLSAAFSHVLDEGQQPLLSQKQAEEFLQTYFQQKMQEAQRENLEKGAAFLEENAKKDGVVTLESGLQYKILRSNENGEHPKATDKVTTHYEGRLLSGEVFDSSYERKQPATFPLNGVIKGWTEALQLMRTGEKWRLFIPSDLAYGERGAPPQIKPNSTLIFDVELISIEKQD